MQQRIYTNNLENLDGIDFDAGGVVIGQDARSVLLGMGLHNWLYADSDADKPKHPLDEHSPLLFDIDDPPMVRGNGCTIDGLSNHIRWNDGELNVVVGPYGCGKSSATRAILYDWLVNEANGAGLHICAWEDWPSHLQREFASYRMGYAVQNPDDLSPADMKMLRGYKIRYYKPQRGMVRSLDSYFADVRECAVQGYKNFIFDPWNEHDYALEKGQTETNYVREMLRVAQEMVFELRINMWIITHIAASYFDGTKVRPFRTAAAFGSSNFANKATRGICMARVSFDGEDRMVMKFDKIKPEQIRGELGIVAFEFDRDVLGLRVDGECSLAVAQEWKS